MNKKGEIIVIGSIVRDIVELTNGKKKEFLGGTGANISYGLGVLGLNPTLISVVGKDFSKKIKEYFKKNKINLNIFKDKKEDTAVFSVIKKTKGKDIEIWKPNVFNKIEKLSLSYFLNKKELEKVNIIIFSPGTPISTHLHLKQFYEKGNKDAVVIFDPGQMTNMYTKKQFTECLKFSDILILNELEFKQAEKIIKKKILESFKDKIIIKTLGHKGSAIYKNKEVFNIPIVKPKKVVSAVGAGDAYRAGLIFGILNKMSLEESCKLGAKLASKNVEFLGCQQYDFSL
ncbi:MAG: PfkB family carbohydrate kinase [Candidatus Paceibacterota bacterium]|jgi:adenosine kinase